jgi:predicted short-subunit dehydrogenase-like oxidoreductase (DUF2520 family)
MISVTIIGSGNVAQHLVSAFAKSDLVEIVQVFSRQKVTSIPAIEPSKIVSEYTDLKLVDLFIIAVSDDAIAAVSSQIPFANMLVAHTSGGVAMGVLDSKHRKAVFYPLQTFTKNKPIVFSEIPICLETQHQSDYQILETVAISISQKVFSINSEQRKALHVSAVFVNNFVNHLYQIGNEICIENNIDFEILKPLILETSKKIETLSPKQAQTGPAKRNDNTTIESHLAFLNNENQKEIYKILTQSIQENGKKL